MGAALFLLLREPSGNVEHLTEEVHVESREYMRDEPSLPGSPTSPWLDGVPETSFPALHGEVHADVAVVGGGLAGTLTAHLLAEAGRSVVLLERRRVAGNTSGHTTAKASIHHGPVYAHLRETFGELGALRYALANLRGLNLLAQLCGEVGCDFRRLSSYLYAEASAQRELVRAEEQVMRALGLPVAYEEDVDVPFPFGGAVKLRDQGQFDPARLIVRLLERRPENLRVFEETAVTAVADGEPCVVTASDGSVRCRDVVLASQFPAVDTGAFFARLIPHTANAIAVTVRHPIPDAMFIGRYAVRYLEDRQHLVVSGARHDTGQVADDRKFYRELIEWTRRYFEVEDITHHWSAEDFTAPDRVPYIGRSPFTKHLWLASGFGGWGMTTAAASALLLTGLIAGEPDPEARFFDPARPPASGLAEMLDYGLKTAESYTIGRVLRPQLRDAETLRPDEGAVVAHEGRTYAAYREPSGQLHLLDPVCRHLACQVTWNEAEKTWDCPCHGSRYAYDGTPVYAPTRSPLLPARAT